MKNLNYEDIGHRIRCKLEEMYGKHQQAVLAKHLGISTATVTLMLKGKSINNACRFFSICNYLNNAPSFFLTGEKLFFSEEINTDRIFDNSEIRKIWQLMRKNSFPNYDSEIIKAEDLADFFGFGAHYIKSRDYEYNSKKKQTNISLDDIHIICEMYNIPIDAIWCNLNGIQFKNYS